MGRKKGSRNYPLAFKRQVVVIAGGAWSVAKFFLGKQEAPEPAKASTPSVSL